MERRETATTPGHSRTPARGPSRAGNATSNPASSMMRRHGRAETCQPFQGFPGFLSPEANVHLVLQALLKPVSQVRILPGALTVDAGQRWFSGARRLVL